MGEQRRVYRRGNSWVVPVPRAIRAHMKLLAGGDLFWHVGPKGEAYVTTTAHRPGGRPPGKRLDRDLTAAHAEIERLRRRLSARPPAVYNEGVNEGRMRHMGELVRLGAQLDALTDEVRALAARLPFSRRARPARAQHLRGVETIPAPSLSSPSEVIDGGAVTSGAEPPGDPR